MIERLSQAPRLPYFVSFDTELEHYIGVRRAQLRENAEFWRGQAWWVLAAEIAAFECARPER